jgi:hypothetical protein
VIPADLFLVKIESFSRLTKMKKIINWESLSSQGAQVLHKSVANLPPAVSSHIKAVVVFGDPDKGKPIRGISNSIIHTECYSNDMVCNGIPLPVGAHNQYDRRVNAVTEWIVQTLGPA